MTLRLAAPAIFVLSLYEIRLPFVVGFLLLCIPIIAILGAQLAR